MSIEDMLPVLTEGLSATRRAGLVSRARAVHIDRARIAVKRDH